MVTEHDRKIAACNWRPGDPEPLELTNKLKELQPFLCDLFNAPLIMSSLRAMGPLNFYDNCRNSDEIAGAIRVLDWILSALKP